MSCDVLLIGYGKIATYVAAGLHDTPEVAIRWVITRPGREGEARKHFAPDVELLNSVADLGARPDVALECASHAGLAEHGPALLQRGVELGILSIGALADPQLSEKLDRAAHEGSARPRILSGAIGALDALSAAREGGLDEVTYTGTKPPAAWRGSAAEEACDLAALSEAMTFFRGPAREAASRYPKNANVAATVALCGVGLDATQVCLIADPDAPGNVHRISARGAFGELEFTVRGRALPDNPKTSALTAMSALRFLREQPRYSVS